MSSQTVIANGLVGNHSHWRERLDNLQQGDLVTVRDVKQAEPKLVFSSLRLASC